MKITGLRGRKVVDRVRRKGKRWRGKHMNITYVVNGTLADTRYKTQETRAVLVGTSASTKLNKSAVKRNRMRRRCREALRVTIKDPTKNQKLTTKNLRLQLLLQPRSSSLTCDFVELRSDT